MADLEAKEFNLNYKNIEELNSDCKFTNMQDFLLCKNGQGVETVDNTGLSRALKKKKVNIVVDLAEGYMDFTAWTSDLTEEYIRINADYRS